MYLEIQQRIRARFVAAVKEVFALEVDEPGIDFPPNAEMGDLSITACFELAKKLRQPPRKIAEQLTPRLLPLEGVARVAVAGGGYINFFLDREKLAGALFALRAHPQEPGGAAGGKVLVEHTSINPNKAAHIGHLRNAVLGDTFARLLRFRENSVEIQNYIDNTGVQVADVVVGFVHLEKKPLSDVERLIQDPAIRFDYYCWDLYARVFQWYEGNQEARALRSAALKAIEEGHGEMAALAERISTAIVRQHIQTMLRINVRYDLLVQESEILRLEFWKYAFEVLKQTGAIRFEDSGKNAGCWVMSLAEGGEGETTDEQSGSEDVKIIVRSNGTVTYVGKDIAYHLWKFALLGKDFGYKLFHRYADGHPVWCTALESDGNAPRFGKATVAYAVIDTRQSYLQNIVAAALDALGFHQQAENLHHFAYEVVGLSPRCAEEMGLELSAEDRQRPYIEVSGRKGLGIKADDLIDRLLEKARQEVESRKMAEDSSERMASAGMIAVAALRYFLLKYSRRAIIAFDFKDALAFEGETGPYLQYTVVRARNIFRKFQESHPGFDPNQLQAEVPPEQSQAFLSGKDAGGFWELVVLAAQLEMVTDQAIAAQEPAVVAKYAFRLAQAFNNFYHYHHILSEEDKARQSFLLFLVQLVNLTLAKTVELLGMEVPERM
ncbi:MAG: arginine--tRNA ligase [Terriglobia bacterium]